MLLLMALLAQDLVGPPGDEPMAPRVNLTRRRDCAPGRDEIVVCGTAPSPRLVPLPKPEPQRVFGPARIQLSPNKSMTARAEESGNPFLPTPRLMIDFKIDF